jgi:hypothetical protein
VDELIFGGFFVEKVLGGVVVKELCLRVFLRGVSGECVFFGWFFVVKLWCFVVGMWFLDGS